VGRLRSLIPFALVLCLGGAIQKTGLLFFLNNQMFSSLGATPSAIAALFLPIPVVSFLLIYKPVLRPEKHLVSIYIVFSILFVFHNHLGLAGLSAITAMGVWFNIAAQGALGSSKREWIRPLSGMMLGSIIIGAGAGALLAESEINWIYLLSAVSLLGALVAVKRSTRISCFSYHDSFNLKTDRFPILKLVVIICVLISAGTAEVTILERIHNWNLGAGMYGWLLFSHSIASILALCAPTFRLDVLSWNVIWYFSVAGVIWFPFWATVLCYAGLGAAGSVLMREFRVSYLMNASNPAKTAAVVSLFLSTGMATGALLGVFWN